MRGARAPAGGAGATTDGRAASRIAATASRLTVGHSSGLVAGCSTIWAAGPPATDMAMSNAAAASPLAATAVSGQAQGSGR